MHGSLVLFNKASIWLIFHKMVIESAVAMTGVPLEPVMGRIVLWTEQMFAMSELFS